eukprot:CAMPEP_0172471890 /NCGR_PEP_ID=MMETSP1065-20121228/68052_1 /TAXON_ID=265537 /ORGANISM="Amphiprora paludosa, Strain CCMP125" /LENGTH=398 /DNA_ID=CAMNT_0013230005 /DNA_START=75 /DNA_END=1271 /DNA_ORIENTATION=+
MRFYAFPIFLSLIQEQSVNIEAFVPHGERASWKSVEKKKAKFNKLPTYFVSELSTTAESSISPSMELSDWADLNPESLVSAPCLIEQTLCQPSEEQPQMAKDLDYARAVMDAWKQEELDDENVWETVWCHCTYSTQDDNQVTPLYGHLIQKPSTIESEKKACGVIFFHTGAGPHDLFLLYKAASLVNRGGDQDTVVLVADILSDETGWAWGADRTLYNQQRKKLLEAPGRSTLQKRVQAAIRTLQALEYVDSDRLGVMGWCLGGHPVMEVAKLENPAVRAMATFHGVFDGVESNVDNLPLGAGDEETDDAQSSNLLPAEVLICNGVEDPFVPDKSLEQALGLLQKLNYRASLLQLVNAKHGFTNPAQDFNDNPSFAFQKEAADKSWKQAVNMFQRALR